MTPNLLLLANYDTELDSIFPPGSSRTDSEDEDKDEDEDEEQPPLSPPIVPPFVKPVPPIETRTDYEDEDELIFVKPRKRKFFKKVVIL